MPVDSWPAHDDDIGVLRRVVVVPGRRTAPERTKGPHGAGLKAVRSSPHAAPTILARPGDGNPVRPVTVTVPDKTERYRGRRRAAAPRKSHNWLAIWTFGLALAAFVISGYALVHQHRFEACVQRNLQAIHAQQIAIANYTDDSPPALEACGGGPSAPRWINPS